ncbi:MAG: hypothetical protein ACREOO_15635 [bacterium]
MRTSKNSGEQKSGEYPWDNISNEYGISKRAFGKKIKFVTDSYRRKIIFRDIEHAYILSKRGFSKPAVILAGGVIEEMLRLYLVSKGVTSSRNSFAEYVKACEKGGFLKSGIRLLSDSVRHFRNLVHLELEKSKKHTISKATATGAVSSIFTITNDF